MEKPKEDNYKSVEEILLALNLDPYEHVCIRAHVNRIAAPIGGGHPSDIIRRFGNRLVTDSSIFDNALILYVLPQEGDIWVSPPRRTN